MQFSRDISVLLLLFSGQKTKRNIILAVAINRTFYKEISNPLCKIKKQFI